jgi:hypothetical protein
MVIIFINLSTCCYADAIYQSAAASTLNPLDAIFLHFVTGDSFITHHCILYQKVGWTSLKSCRSHHYTLFVYKALLHKLPTYLKSLFRFKMTSYQTRSQVWLTLETLLVSRELGESAFHFLAPYVWNDL